MRIVSIIVYKQIQCAINLALGRRDLYTFQKSSFIPHYLNDEAAMSTVNRQQYIHAFIHSFIHELPRIFCNNIFQKI